MWLEQRYKKYIQSFGEEISYKMFSSMPEDVGD
jgi:hypothetical protein